MAPVRRTADDGCRWGPAPAQARIHMAGHRQFGLPLCVPRLGKEDARALTNPTGPMGVELWSDDAGISLHLRSARRWAARDGAKRAGTPSDLGSADVMVL